MTSKSQKDRAQKKYPQRNDKKGELFKVSEWRQTVKKKERKKWSPEARQKNKESSSKPLNDINKSIIRFPIIVQLKIYAYFMLNVLGTFPVRFPDRFPVTFLCGIGTLSGFAAIFRTANSLCSPVRKESPASRACGKKGFPKAAVGQRPKKS